VSVGTIFRVHGARLAVGAIALALFGLARATSGQPEPAPTALRFEALPLGAPDRPGDRRERPVNPRYQDIRGWISAVGAAAALADIDGDGRPNDICLVDPRDDSVSVMPAPGTGERYVRFALPTPTGPQPAAIAPMGCLPGDYDEDGHTDLLVYYWGRPPLIYRATGATPGASGYTQQALVDAFEPWYTNAALQADVDGDGHVDLLFGNYFPENARVLDPDATGGGMMQRSMSRARNSGRNRLFMHNPGSPTGYTDHSSALDRDMASGWTLAMAAADLDGDLLPEIYIANDFGSDRLLVNLSRPGVPRFMLATGRRTFTTPRSRTLGADSFKGMGAEFADLNGDGQLDLAVSNIAQDYALLESHFLFINDGQPALLKQGIAAFTDESGPRGTARNGWGWDIKAADFDNDSRPELLQALGFLEGRTNRWPELQELATANDGLLEHPAFWAAFADGADLSGNQRNRLYAQDESGLFRDVGLAAGLDMTGVSRGIAVADIDLDGRLDVVIARQWRQSLLLRNRSPAGGAFLSLDLRLPNANGSSRPAIGAVVRVDRPGRAQLLGFVDGGNGHSGKSAAIVHLGLGASPAPAPVTIEWRDSGALRRARLMLAPGHHRLLLGRSSA